MINQIDFNTALKQLKTRLKDQLPGHIAQVKMAPSKREKGLDCYDIENSRASAVLILIYPDNNELHTVFIKRPDYNGPHSGQISLPGGKYEDFDSTLQDTALRETFEEVGINPITVTTIGQLSQLYIPHSNYLVTPYVGYCTEYPNFIPDTYEVDRIITTSIAHLLERKNRKEFIFRNSRNEDIIAPYFDLHGEKLWGATAMIMSEFLEVLK